MQFHFSLFLCHILFPPPAHIACLALVFTPHYFFLNLYLFALIVPPLLPPVVQFSIVSLTVLMALCFFLCSLSIPLIPLFHPIPVPLIFTLSIHLSIRCYLLFMNLVHREKRRKMHLQLQEDSFASMCECVCVCVRLATAGLCIGAERQFQADFVAVCLAGRWSHCLSRKYSNECDEDAQPVWHAAELFGNIMHSEKGYYSH